MVKGLNTNFNLSWAELRGLKPELTILQILICLIWTSRSAPSPQSLASRVQFNDLNYLLQKLT